MLSLLLPEVWTPFHDLLIAFLAIFEGLLLPLVFYVADETFRQAVQRACCSCGRRRRALSKIGSSSSNSNSSNCNKSNPALAFVDRALLSTPPYLKTPLPPAPPSSIRAAPLYQSRPASLALMASNYQSELDLSKRGLFVLNFAQQINLCDKCDRCDTESQGQSESVIPQSLRP